MQLIIKLPKQDYEATKTASYCMVHWHSHRRRHNSRGAERQGAGGGAGGGGGGGGGNEKKTEKQQKMTEIALRPLFSIAVPCMKIQGNRF